MNQKKELVIKVLERLQWHRDMARDLLVIVKSSYCSDEILNSIIIEVNKAIKTVKENDDKLLLEKSLQLLKKIQILEKNIKISGEDLDKFLDDIE